jgi:hypothetical protein
MVTGPERSALSVEYRGINKVQKTINTHYFILNTPNITDDLTI